VLIAIGTVCKGIFHGAGASTPSPVGPDPTFDVTSLLSGLVGDLGLPVSITGGDLTLNLTGLVSEVLAGL
jgi:hypothetical protein